MQIISMLSLGAKPETLGGGTQLSRWFWCAEIRLPLTEYSSTVETQWKYWTKCLKSLVKWKEPRDFGFPRNNLTSNFRVGENALKLLFLWMWPQLTAKWLLWGIAFGTMLHLKSTWCSYGHKESSDFLFSREEGFPLSLHPWSWALFLVSLRLFLKHKLAEEKKLFFHTI